MASSHGVAATVIVSKGKQWKKLVEEWSEQESSKKLVLQQLRWKNVPVKKNLLHW